MTLCQWGRLVLICIVLCGRVAHAATESGATTTVAANSEAVSSATPAPGGTVTSVGTTQAVTMDSTLVSTVGTTEAVTLDSTLVSTVGTTQAVTLDSTLVSTVGTTEAVTPDSTLVSTVGTTEAVTLDSTLVSTVGTTEAVTLDSTLVSTVDSEETTTLTVDTEAPPSTTVQPLPTSEGCVCDLSPDFCDIGCCCDTVDCDVANLSTVFTTCPQKAIEGFCIEKWLMFKASVNPSFVTVTDSLFCVRAEANAPRTLPSLLQDPAIGDSYHFSPPAPPSNKHQRDFYRVDDVIQTYFSNSSVRGLLRQPSPGPAAAFCVNSNPAKFLRSVSLSCTRMLSPQSCTTDPNLNARSYFSDLSLIKIPIAGTAVSDVLIPVTPLSDWPAPSKQNNSCVNVVKNVEFVIGYTGRGELTYATVNVVLADVDPNQLLMQTHSVQFQLATPSPTPVAPAPAVGLKVGSPVIGRFGGEVMPLKTLGVSQSGDCSSDPHTRAPILFAHNSVTGCTFSSPSSDCSELRSQMYGILQGLATPDVIAMNFGSEPDWTRAITQECPVSLQETCETGCFLPSSLSIRVLWARQGLLDLPQNYILGAKYLFHCEHFKCPTLSPIVLTTEVTFVDNTVYPEPPRGLPQPTWKFPFDFFTRGIAELDGHIVISGSVTDKVTWSLMLFTVMLLKGLEFFTS